MATTVEQVPTTSLRPSPRNARTHSDKQVAQLAKSISKFGFTNPILIDDGKNVLAGHGRLAAAKQLGMANVPCLKLRDMTEAEKRAYILADNRLAEKAGWDQEILAGELQALCEVDFDFECIGFDQIEIDGILTEQAEGATESQLSSDDDIPEPQEQAVSRHGDLWKLGRHLLLCGDAQDPQNYRLLMGEAKAAMAFTDPPYNVKIDGHVSGLGETHHREFLQASGEMTPEQFTSFLQSSFSSLAANCRDGAIVYVCMDWRHMGEVLAAGRLPFSELKNLCVWSKTNGGMGTFYRSQHELVFVWKAGTAPHTNNFGLGDKGRYRTNVWSYPGVNTFKRDRGQELGMHPTVKPVAMVAEAIRDVSNRGEIVLDPFGGSGTTLIAAQKTGRCARLIELDPLYCDVIIRRFQALTGKSAILAATGESFERAETVRKLVWPSQRATELSR